MEVKKYYIQDAIPDPDCKVTRMPHWELMDGSINGYIRSEHFIVTDEENNIITKELET